MQGKYAESELLYKRALAIKEKILGKNHPDVAIILKNLAWLYETQGKYAESELLYQRCLAILREKFPKDHPNIDSMQKSYDAMKRKMAEQK